ncbi:hypothetical protein [Acetivibrio mesophilus]|uniref:Uncharacterized protein n=1 Tax=Acetivibrio mesophilus TaxID=2487273 RepID=A0A4Q0I740_9FIRM|nr:hypothetical protein [Acetivibrio mesophilus]ODM25553.1 hypothetical protein A7W90_04565 [Clostridium sp. Bc-iso-3]RXE60138.1 hypothetical protein EFD62_02590 [Acetivibrio mesophilus]HHV29105.1 hypothetical protein [Clostridium sp.]
MKNLAIMILVIVFASILFQPFFEMVEIFSEKAQIDSAVESAAKSARLTGFKLTDIRDLEKKFNFDMYSEDENFISVFCEVFSATLKLDYLYVSDNKAYFRSNNVRYNDFVVEFQYDADYPDECHIIVTTEYKFKRNYLKEFVGDNSFELVRERTLFARMEN